MTPILEGNEVEKTFDNGAGKALVNVEKDGSVVVSFSYKKDVDVDGYAKASANVELKAETNFFDIAQKLAAKTETKFDDTVVAGIKALLGMA